jgi:dTDP-glucose 4,6-dehydratase
MLTSMNRLLVTGGAGFIGANFVQHWLGAQPDDRVVVLDALTYAGCRASLDPVRDHPGLLFIQGDIRDGDLVESILRAEAIDTLVHFAAESHVDRSITGPDAFVDTNVIGTHALLKAARRVWLEERSGAPHRFHHVSTDEVYGSLGPKDPGFNETTPYAPNSPYSASKAGSDHLVRAYHHTYGLSTTISNCSNNYGPYQFPEKLIPLMIIHALTGKALPVYGDGLNVRDWLHVEDHCRAIGLILQLGRAGETYNVGGNGERDNRDVVARLCETIDTRFASDKSLASRFPKAPAASGKPTSSAIRYVTDRPGHDRRYAIDARKIGRELGFEPRHVFESGLAATVDWYLANEPWWSALLRRT